MNSSNESGTHFVLNDAVNLKFPDWSGMKPHETRMTFAEAVRWNDEMLTLFLPKRLAPELEAQSRCHAEFVL